MPHKLSTSTPPSLSRRDFLKVLAASATAAALAPTLAACTDRYAAQVQHTWNPVLQTETNMPETMREIVRCATLAASGHNTQPWKFSIQEDVIRIFPDYSRRLPAVDPDDRELFISLGCALENLVVAARQSGYDSETAYFPEGEVECLRVRLSPAAAASDPLFGALSARQCTRCAYDGQPVPASDLDKIESVSGEAGVSAQIITTGEQIEALVEYVIEGDQSQFGDQAFIDELVTWLRFSKSEALKTLDGLYSACSGNPTVPRWLGKRFVTAASGEQQADKDAKMMRSSPGMLLIATEDENPRSWVQAGRLYERLALTMTGLGIKTAFMNQPVEVADLRPQLATYLGLGTAHPQLLFRFGYSQSMPRSLRRAVEAVLS